MSGSFIQGRHGVRGNFEVVAPLTHGPGLYHLWRNNDDTNLPWSAQGCFGSGDIGSACLIQSNFGATGNLEVVARDGEQLVFYWRMDRAPWTWSGPFALATQVQGNPALIQSRHGTKGNFELIAPHRLGGMLHMWRNNDAANLPWSAPSRFGSGAISGISFIQGNFSTPGNLELLAVEGDRLAFYWRMDRAPWTWNGTFVIATGVRGVPSLIQGRHGTKGNFEAVVPHRDGGLVHLWRNNDNPARPWSPPARFGAGRYDEVCCIQSNFGSPGNLEVVARGPDGRLDFYWRIDRAPWTWSGPFLIGAERLRNVSECIYSWRSAFFQSDTHVIARIQLNPDAGITGATMASLRTTWRNGIINKWSNLFDCRARNDERRRITVDVHWVTSNPHHVVRVRPGPAQSDMTTWDTADTGDVASHEFGHMLGHPDEYASSTCPSRNPVNTGTVMDDNTEVVERLVETLANFHCNHDAVPTGPAEASTEHAGEEVTAMRRLELLDASERSKFAERMRQTSTGAGDARSVTLIIAGGALGERYECRAEVGPDGRGEMSLLDEVHGRRESRPHLSVEVDQVRRLFERVSAPEVLDVEHPLPGLVPDSLVGTLVITDGEVEKRIHFPVDTETGRAREPGESDVLLDFAAGLLLRQEYATPGIRSVVEILPSIAGLVEPGGNA